METRPLEDETANIFKEPSNLISICLLKGNTAGEAHQKSKAKYKELILKCSSSNALPESAAIRSVLQWDMTSQKLIGDPGARI